MSQRIIIFCGPDRTGKTEISIELSKRLNIPRFKASSENINFVSQSDQFLYELQYADPRLIDFLKQTKHSVIFDRAYPCEWVYSKFFGRKTDDSRLIRNDTEFSRLNTKIIICSRSDYSMCHDEDDPVRLRPENLKKLDSLYREFSTWARPDTLILNVDDEDLDREMNEILVFLGEK